MMMRMTFFADSTASMSMGQLLITVLLVVLTAALTHLFTSLREVAKQQKDEEEKAKDRALNLKKEVYLSTIAELAHLERSILEFASPTGDIKSHLEKAGELEASTRKIYLIAPLPICRLTIQIGKIYRIGMLDIVAGQVNLKHLLKEIETTEGTEDSKNANALFLLEHTKQTGRCLELCQKLKMSSVPLIREIRRDLDTTLDMKTFESILQEDVQNSLDTFNALKEKADKLVKDKVSDVPNSSHT